MIVVTVIALLLKWPHYLRQGMYILKGILGTLGIWYYQWVPVCRQNWWNCLLVFAVFLSFWKVPCHIIIRILTIQKKLVQFNQTRAEVKFYFIKFTLILQLERKSLMFKCDSKINQGLFIFNSRKLFGESKRLISIDLSGTRLGEPRTRPLAVQHLDNGLYIYENMLFNSHFY